MPRLADRGSAVHVLCDAQRALVAFASPAVGPADVDSVSYWRPFAEAARSPEAIAAHGWRTRRWAVAFDKPTDIVSLWNETSAAAARVAAGADPAGFVATQGHTLTLPDFIVTLIIEACIHHLDLISDLPDAEPPEPAVLATTARTMDGLLSPARRPDWPLTDYLLKASGRIALTTTDRQSLGASAGHFPLLG